MNVYARCSYLFLFVPFTVFVMDKVCWLVSKMLVDWAHCEGCANVPDPGRTCSHRRAQKKKGLFWIWRP